MTDIPSSTAPADLIRLLERVLMYLEHPEVTAIQFAAPSEIVAAQVRAAIEALQAEPEENPYILSGDELARSEARARAGERY